jgi:hypothetical protein
MGHICFVCRGCDIVFLLLSKDTDCVTQRMELHHVMGGGRNGISPF